MLSNECVLGHCQSRRERLCVTDTPRVPQPADLEISTVQTKAAVLGAGWVYFAFLGWGGRTITLAALEGPEDTWELVARGSGWALGTVVNLTGVPCSCGCRGYRGVYEASAMCQAPCVHNATARPWPP